MSDTAVQNLPVEETYSFHAYSAPMRLSLKQISENLSPDRIQRFSSDCLVYHVSNRQKVFVFRYGTAVLFNIPAEEHNYFLLQIGISPAPQSSQTDAITEESFILKVAPGRSAEVGFNSVTLPGLDVVVLQLVAQVLAQSSALELIEREVSEFLAESETMTGFLRKGGIQIRRREKLLKFIGLGLGARHRIISQLALLSEPDITWEKEDLHQVYRKLFSIFDINERIAKIEKMLSLSGEVTSLLLEMVNTRRAEILEIIIIALILVEVLRAI